jgi:hypothetical protein
MYLNYEGAKVCFLKGNIVPEENGLGTGILLDILRKKVGVLAL